MMLWLCTVAWASRDGFESYGKYRGQPHPSSIPAFHVEYGTRLPLRPPGAKVPEAPKLPSPEELDATTEAMYALFVDKMTGDGWTFVGREKLVSDPAYLALPEEDLPYVRVPQAYRPLPLGDGRLASPRILAPVGASLRVESAFSLYASIQWCETKDAVVPCLRGVDTDFGWGDPGFTLFLYQGRQTKANGDVRLARSGGIVKRFTFSRDPRTGANLDEPILPRNEGTYSEQALDGFEQALDRSLGIFRKRIKPRPPPPKPPEPPKAVVLPPPPDQVPPEGPPSQVTPPAPTPSCWPAESCGTGEPPSSP